MQFALDSNSHGVQFKNLTASVENDRIHLTGVYDASELVPVLLFSVGVPWVEPCVRHICCLWDIVDRYRDHDLMLALGPTCNENANLTALDLMKGNPPDASTWDVRTMIHPSFVAMLFLCVAPTFYMYYEIIPMQWTAETTLRWSSSWYGQPCHPVIYPHGRPVCIYCANSKPENAVFVFSANWFATFQCQWVCNPGFTGPNCDIAINLALYISASVFAALCVGALVLFGLYGPRKAAAVPAETAAKKVEKTAQPPAQAQIRTEAIAFREGAHPDIRIKLL